MRSASEGVSSLSITDRKYDTDHVIHGGPFVDPTTPGALHIVEMKSLGIIKIRLLTTES